MALIISGIPSFLSDFSLILPYLCFKEQLEGAKLQVLKHSK